MGDPRKLLGITILLTSVLIAGCSGPAAAPGGGQPVGGNSPPAPAAAAAPVNGSTVMLGQRDTPENMNYYNGVFSTTVVFSHFYEPLVQFDMSKDFRLDFPVIPWLAESWSQPDDKTWIFKIRDGVKWHDGTPLTAEGVVWSLEYLRDPKNNYAARSNLANVDKITAEGNTVRMTMTKPTPTHLLLMRSVYIMPKHIFDAGGVDALSSKSVGTGPFSLVSMDRNSKTVFKKFPQYWRKDEAGRQQPYLDGLQFTHNMDQSTQQAALAAGQLDLFNFSDKAQVDAFLKRSKDLQLLSYQFGSDVVLFLNHKAPPLDRKEVRQALHLVLNRQEIIDNVAGGQGLLGLPAIPAMKEGWSIPQAELVKMPGYRPDKKEDLAQARKLLEQAGVPRGWDIRFLNRATYNSAPQGEQAANQLKAAGLKVNYQPLDDATILKEERAGNFDIFLELGANPDPAQAYARYHSKGASNYSKLADPEVDALTEKLQVTMDKPEQQKLSRQLQERILSEYLQLPLADPTIFTVQQPWIRGYQSNRATQMYFMGNVNFLWMDPEKLPAGRR